MRHPTSRILLALVLLACILASPSQAVEGQVPEKAEGPGYETLLIPYAFYANELDVAFGGAFALLGYPERQAGFVGSAVVSTNGSWAFYVLGQDYRPTPWERLFFDPWISIGRFREMEVHRSGNPDFPDEVAATNDSDVDNFIEGEGGDAFVFVTLKYLLPIGHGRDDIIPRYVLDRGILVDGASGATDWSPFESGRFFIDVQPFYCRQSIDSKVLGEDVLKTNGLKVRLAHDNTDFPANPSRGSSKRIGIMWDNGWFDSTAPWTVLGGEFSKYVNLGPTKNLRQRVLAFNVWTANCLTWDDTTRHKGDVVLMRPPGFAGATLGGLMRMRGFVANRFSDRAAIFYTAECRVIPDWNPLADLPYIRTLDVDWIRAVVFGEIGRVAPSWNLSELHKDMKWASASDSALWPSAWSSASTARSPTRPSASE
jgi:hypothetical protein